MKRKLLLGAISIFIFFFAISVMKNMIGLYQSGGRLQSERDQVTALERENETLRKQIDEAQKPHYIEQIAREQLNMAKPQETVVVLPQPVATIAAVTTMRYEGSNWQRWYALFFER